MDFRNFDKKHLIYGSGGLAVLVVVVLALVFSGGSGGSAVVEIKANDRTLGNRDAPVILLEYASMTCPHCAAFAATVLPQVIENYVDTGKVFFIFREYPLDGAARLASALARCVPEDNYFPFVDLLFMNQIKWLHDFNGDAQLTREDLDEGLTQMGRMTGMGREQVMACMDNPANLAAVDENWEEGNERYGVGSTPAFVVDGVTHANIASYEQIAGILNSALGDSQ